MNLTLIGSEPVVAGQTGNDEYFEVWAAHLRGRL